MSTLLKNETNTNSIELLLAQGIPDYNFSLPELLKMEKDILGIYASAHPLSVYRKMLPGKITGRYLDIRSSYIEQLNPGQSVQIAGLLVQVRRQFTKNNKIMAFLLLEDELGLFEAIAFPETFCEYFSLLKKDALLLLKGNISNQDREEKIIIQEISDICSLSK
ncbi:MAG: hypothetical protein PHD33_03630 [Atribacterota bacterium]|nr:hypothetical protein [Atribacterota bacterium]